MIFDSSSSFLKKKKNLFEKKKDASCLHDENRAGLMASAFGGMAGVHRSPSMRRPAACDGPARRPRWVATRTIYWGKCFQRSESGNILPLYLSSQTFLWSFLSASAPMPSRPRRPLEQECLSMRGQMEESALRWRRRWPHHGAPAHAGL